MRRERSSFHECATVAAVLPAETSASGESGDLRASGSKRVTATMPHVQAPHDGDDWLAITDAVLPIGEAYEEQVVPRLRAIAEETRARWPVVGRLVLLHRTGPLRVGESSVLVVASAPHRPEAFAAARFAIDALKASVPIWKHEVWSDGADWGTGAADVRDAASVDTSAGSASGSS